MKQKKKTKEEIKKEIFDMVYGWGRANIVVDESAPAYQKIIQELLLKDEK